jgi:hypothetical protein
MAGKLGYRRRVAQKWRPVNRPKRHLEKRTKCSVSRLADFAKTDYHQHQPSTGKFADRTEKAGASLSLARRAISRNPGNRFLQTSSPANANAMGADFRATPLRM